MAKILPESITSRTEPSSTDRCGGHPTSFQGGQAISITRLLSPHVSRDGSQLASLHYADTGEVGVRCINVDTRSRERR